ncbi:PLP-dependent transferase [Moesziomyces antarcticus]|uniref:cystathionine gamma-synthase n=2 Tax=Pseudozyma antarctica TaxID=84753 RepID=A0A081CMU1_PSEA2|nr:PLP-dependent transferase [Moesziomyces antarcticus]GAK67987.1 PLP-dependent transferase [Moesziomyces antarcticus]SPO47163.1 probable STR2 - Cystathionine gamma-synthase [Moesziomyces antarcticus]
MQLATPVPLPTAPPPSAGAAAACKKDLAVGTSIPANMPHAVSVSLPLWSDNIDYEEGRLSNAMETGYPRFFIHRSIQRLGSLLSKKFARPDEACILFPSAKIADRCRDYMRTLAASPSPLPIRIVRFSMLEHSASAPDATSSSSSSTAEHVADQLDATHHHASSTTAHYIFIVFFPAHLFPLAKSFWQHTGDGISSRQADRCLSLLEHSSRNADQHDVANKPAAADTAPAPESAISNSTDDMYKKSAGKRFYNRYTRTNSHTATPSPNSSAPQTPSSSGILQRPSTAGEDAAGAAAVASVEPVSSDLVTYVEERYGRNLPLTSAPSAKLALRRRIAGTLLSDRSEQSATEAPGDQVGESGRTGTGVTEDDVFLFPCGMSAIFHAHQLAMRAAPRLVRADSPADAPPRAVGKSVCFGFPYTDTLKILQKFGPGCHFYGLGVDDDLDSLEELLQTQQQQQHASGSGEAPVLALFCEFPSNPLLRSPNLPRIRALADAYNVLVCVDETIGNFVNVEVLPYADVLVSSLTKVFSGDANVMGGSLVLNPKGPHYAALREVMREWYEDTYFDEDAIFMERNSRDFIRRIVRIDANTRAVTEMLWRAKEDTHKGVVKQLFYPRYQTPENYNVCRRRKAFTELGAMEGDGGGGYGGLFSITFASEAASKAFYDTLQCAKGPSLGTNLTLASPYTILAHYGELEWAAQFGVERGLVRVSVGLEDQAFLLKMFGDSLDAAARAHASA